VLNALIIIDGYQHMTIMIKSNPNNTYILFIIAINFMIKSYCSIKKNTNFSAPKCASLTLKGESNNLL